MKQNDLMHGIKVEVHHNNYHNKNNLQNRYRSISRDRFSYDQITTPPQ